jgi:hypothetical protein
MISKVKTGEGSEKGDRVLFESEPDRFELVRGESGEPATNWFLPEHGGAF